MKWCISLVCLLWFYLSLPSQLFKSPTSFVISDANNNLLNASIAADEQWRFPYNAQVPEKFAKCITAFEDKRFYYHPGVDPMAMCRAIWQNSHNKKTVSGGSTLTMQVVRLYKHHQGRTIWNKLTETIAAIRLECSYKKQSILALYASNAPFGSNVVGLDAAAWRYYGRDASQLTWGEMAALAVLPNAPALVHPGKNRATLLRKRNELLNKLAANKTIDVATANLAKLELLPSEPKALPQFAPHLLDRFKKAYPTISKSQLITTSITTTIDGNLQKQVTAIILQQHKQLIGNQINNAAAMVVEIETGFIKAYIGNVYQPANANIESHVDVLSSVRSPGSTLKPLLYGSLLTEGTMLPKQLIPDIPTQIGGYAPENFDLGYDGAVPANKALSRSLNIPAVKMLQQYKYQRFYNVLKQCGFTSLKKPADFYGMSLILGGCEVSPFELAGVYSSMARLYNHQLQNKGQWNAKDWFMPKYFKVTEDREQMLKKNVLATIDQQLSTSLFDYTALWHTFNAMNEVMRPGEEGLWNLFSSAQRIAWKTGTSFGFRDGWAIGLTPKYCVVVWVGNTSGVGRPELTGINTAGPILFDIFRLLPKSAWFNPPSSGFNYINVCHQSGFKASVDCGATDTVMVSEAAKNALVCPYCKKINLDKTATYRVTDNCESPSNMVQASWFILPPTIDYYYQQKHPDYKPLPSFKIGCNTDITRVLDLIYPEENSKIYVPIEASGEKGKSIFTATHRTKNTKLFWHLDDAYVGTTQQFHQLAMNPIPGKHLLTIIDEQGNSVSRNFEILQKEKH
ncbi:MAG: penicillin-binding protein 1C [Deinococcales bacterium]|nr:penicillin-binding protein 1C [Chitinophagaceae bacterium]